MFEREFMTNQSSKTIDANQDHKRRCFEKLVVSRERMTSQDAKCALEAEFVDDTALIEATSANNGFKNRHRTEPDAGFGNHPGNDGKKKRNKWFKKQEERCSMKCLNEKKINSQGVKDKKPTEKKISEGKGQKGYKKMCGNLKFGYQRKDTKKVELTTQETDVNLKVSVGIEKELTTKLVETETENVDEKDNGLKLTPVVTVHTKNNEAEDQQNVCENTPVGSKKLAYSRAEIEALRSVDEEGQKSKWVDVYSGFSPSVAREYTGLVADVNNRLTERFQGKISTEIALVSNIVNSYSNMNSMEGKDPVYNAGGRSYKETLMGNSNYNVQTRLIKIDNKIQAFKDLQGKATVARMIDMDALKNIRTIVKKINPGGGRVQYLGGFTVLISYDDRKTTIDAMESAKGMLGRFSHIYLWEGQSLGFERLAWLKIYGLPMHLLHNDVIDTVGNSFGKLVHKANRSESDPDLSFEYIGVLTGEGKKISEEVDVCWRDRKFRVWVSEDSSEWAPDLSEVNDEETRCSGSAEDSDVDRSNGDEEMQEDLNGGDVIEPLPEPEKTSGEGNAGDTASNLVTPLIINDNQSTFKDIAVEKETNLEEDFISSNLFPFDQALEDGIFVQVGGQGKKPKCNNPFGLNDILGIQDDEETCGEECLERNAKGIYNSSDNHMVADNAGRRDGVPITSVVNFFSQEQVGEKDRIKTEVEDTVRFGETLGAKLNGFQTLVRETIKEIGLQSGDK
ncbi:hypothetical protein L1987_77382 [Smallanthus sonchifolius]|uniref:Uncharacterized protein n=1 Tax=Smallanthus sonchifolius TaxID=185202 RepID=A0ACB8Z8V5_9ASTR|nr:hypothetical protein L1987_77382 [Smallanthus sonchifolius]